MNDQLNPYIAGAVVAEAKMFFGRQDVFEWIERNLMGQYVDHVLVIHGQRRVGKTSVFKQLSNRLSKKYIPIFFDLQGISEITYHRFLWRIASETVRVLQQERGISIALPDQAAFSNDPEYFENQFLPGLCYTLKDNTLLFAFDEFDGLEDQKGKWSNQFYDLLRRLVGKEGFSFLFSIGSSGRTLEYMQAAYTGLFKTALYKKISFLRQEDTYQLITKPVEGIFTYSPEAVESIYQITSGHPYYTQLICHELFGYHQKTGANRITEADVASILDEVVELGTSNLKTSWDDASKTERWALTGLARLSEDTSFENLLAYLHDYQVDVNPGDLVAALLHLQEKEVLTKDNHFTIQLVKIWLQKYQSVERAREEVHKIEQSIMQSFNSGIKHKNLGEFDDAIKSLWEALRLDPGNLEARSQLAFCYTAQNQLEVAKIEYEKVLAIDANYTYARLGLSAVYLALGDQARSARNKNKAALYYQEALSLNPDNPEAKQRVSQKGMIEHFLDLQSSTRTALLFALGVSLLLIFFGANRILRWINLPAETPTMITTIGVPASTMTPTDTATLVFTATPTLTHTPTPPPSYTHTPVLSPTPTVNLDIFIDNLGIVMMRVPAGIFSRGGSADISLAHCLELYPASECTLGTFRDQEPIRDIYLDTFYMDMFEITNAQYQACVDAGICTPPSSIASRTRASYYGDYRYDNYPVIHVTWFQAQTYCEVWRKFRLPTEAEWEKAARGTDGRTFPWGEGLSCTNANYYGCIGDTIAVGSYPEGRSPYGLYDLSGNVSEWTADRYSANFYRLSPFRNPTGPASGEARVVRGGSCFTQIFYTRSDFRSYSPPEDDYSATGFRCVFSIQTLPYP